MPTQRKVDTVADLKERLQKATIVVSAEYRGLRVRDMQDMRRKLREGGLEVRVVKNTLLKLAAEAAGDPDIVRIVEGPTALAIGYGDVIEASKASSYAQTARQLCDRGGYLEGSVLGERPG